MFGFIRRPGRALAVVCALGFAAPLSAQTATAPAPKPQVGADLPAAEKVIEKYIEAIGGRAAISAIESIHMTGTLSVPANGMTGSMEMWAAKPNKNVVKQTIAGIGDSTEGFDGTVAWMNSPMSGPMLLTGEQLKQRTADSDFNALLNPSVRYTAMKTVEKTTFDGKDAFKLSMTRKEGGEDIEFYHVSTGLKLGGIATRKSPMGDITITQTLSDYQKNGAILQPMKMKQSITGIDILITFTSVEFNKVDPAVFALPAEIKALIK
jgi:zinc protease